MALMELEKDESFAFLRGLFVRPKTTELKLDRAISAFQRRRGGEKKPITATKYTDGNLISLLDKHPKLFG